MKKRDVRKELFEALEVLPEYQMSLVLAYIKSLKAILQEQEKRLKEEAFLSYLDNLPEEDEELSEAEVVRIEESRKAAQRGEILSHQDVKKELFGK
ncbi:MAG: hypothetical protein AB2L14_07265 [Candidatus Xenobiia bacterium LiM19]